MTIREILNELDGCEVYAVWSFEDTVSIDNGRIRSCYDGSLIPLSEHTKANINSLWNDHIEDL